jgi:hypothetical protein
VIAQQLVPTAATDLNTNITDTAKRVTDQAKATYAVVQVHAYRVRRGYQLTLWRIQCSSRNILDYIFDYRITQICGVSSRIYRAAV